MRLRKIIDALGQETTLGYAEAGDHYKITDVTDPFGRTAQFFYVAGKLDTVIDAEDLPSSFDYEDDFIFRMTTPHREVEFDVWVNPLSPTHRWISATDLSGTERVEFNDYVTGISNGGEPPTGMMTTGDPEEMLSRRNSFYWNRKSWAE